MSGISFNEDQLDRLSEIFSNLGLLLLASMSIPVFTGGTKINFDIFLSGILAFLFCTVESMLLIGGVNDE